MTHLYSASEFSTDSIALPQLRKRLIGECDILTILRECLLKRKACQPRICTSDAATRLAAITRCLAVRRAQLSLLNSAESRWLAKFSPNQLRVPAGQREGGQWTATGGGTPVGGSTTSDAGAGETVRQVDVSSNSVDSATSTSSEIQLISSKNVVTIDYSRALTGISTIDNATKALSETLAQAMSTMDFIPEWTPQVYGTAVHVDFAAEVRALGIPEISSSDVEQSFFNKSIADYGDPGSIRTDVILRNDVGDIIAIYDVKTGGAVLTAARVRELRDHTGVGIEVPIIELQVNRGARIKGHADRRKKIGVVMALLWNPVHQGNADLVAGA